MNKFIIRLVSLIAVSIAASDLSAAVTSTLYGWTFNRNSSGNIDFVSIDTGDGHATFLFSIPIESGYQARDLTYDPSNGNFYGSLFPAGGGPFKLAEITPTGSVTTHTYTGLQVDFVQGMEYFAAKGNVVVAGVDSTSTINALYVINHTGTVLETKLEPSILDQDHLGANSLGLFGGQLHVLDTNDRTNGFSINKWNDPFGTPSLVGVYNGTIIGDPVDLAIDPFTNTFYSSDFSRLVRYDFNLQQLQVVGNYNYPGQIWGIAEVPTPSPEPASVIVWGILGLSAGGIGWYRRRRLSM